MIVKITEKIDVLTNSVLITGASGLIGRRLTQLLLQKGCRVSHLGRSAHPGPVTAFRWDPSKGEFDLRALEGIDTIVHLAGAGIAEKRWSASRKKEILESRVKSTGLLAEVLRSQPHTVSAVVAGSAIGFYGLGMSAEPLTEEHAPGTDFLATVVVEWEKESARIASENTRVVRMRTGIVLSTEGGALRELIAPIRRGVGASLGSGQQFMSWIHIDDLCEMIAWSIRQPQVTGALNAVAPNPVTNEVLTRALATQLKKPIWIPPVPGFMLRMALGEMADLILYGNRISSAKATGLGFSFRYPLLEDALKALLPR